LEGDWNINKVGITKFDTLEQAKNWWNSGEIFKAKFVVGKGQG